MVDRTIAARGIVSPLVLRAFREVPRELFVPADLEAQAYEDRPLAIGQGQTISQPYIVAQTVDSLGLNGAERVLEVGTGSGYAAAILGRVAREVHTVERIALLAEAAAARLARSGVENVHVHIGDGSLGWIDSAPYDAIAVAAAGPVVPQALLDQLAVGGTLVMPIIHPGGVGQILVRIRRLSETELERDELVDVVFVPLIGEQGHRSTAEPIVMARGLARAGSAERAAQIVREAAEPIDGVDDGALDALVERIAGSRLVLLGESTHGTSEFYRLRARITRALVEHHGYDFIAVEGDWPDAARIDDYVRHAPAPHTRFPFVPFDRFPQWMWRNREVSAFVEWLRELNGAPGRDRSVGFYGLDLYSMYTSIGIVVRYLEEIDPRAAALARSRYATVLPHGERQHLLPPAGALQEGEAAVVATLKDVLTRRLDYLGFGAKRFFDAAQNARVVAAAERYYRAIYRGAAESWNLRDSHMLDTLRMLVDLHGRRSKGIVWAHNTHVGDARATEMHLRREHNLGQLCRQAFGDDVCLVGFGTDHGTVAAADDWDGPMRLKHVRAGHPESYEHVMHLTGLPSFVLSFRTPARAAVREELEAARLLRAIGVVYRPETELTSHYSLAVLPMQLDEWVWVDQTHAVTPLPAVAPGERSKLPQTYPFGV